MAFASFFGLGARRERAAVEIVYAGIVEQARTPLLFAGLEVPDTLDGRFESLALHAFLVLNCLKSDRPASADFAQALFDTMFADMDRSLREMGVADLGVGRRVKAMAEALLGRVRAYEQGMAEGDAALEAALRRNLYGTVAGPGPDVAIVAAVARYMRRQQAALAAQPVAALLAGKVEFAPAETAAMLEAGA